MQPFAVLLAASEVHADSLMMMWCCSPQGFRSISFAAWQLLASSAHSTLSIIPGAPAAVGIGQFAVAKLLSSSGWPILVNENARLTATGELVRHLVV
jgi:hypothetical protein